MKKLLVGECSHVRELKGGNDSLCRTHVARFRNTTMLVLASTTSLAGRREIPDLSLEGMPAFSLRGGVLDLGGGRFETNARRPLEPAVRLMSVGHDVTESADIQGIWVGIRHALLFTVAYTAFARH